MTAAVAAAPDSPPQRDWIEIVATVLLAVAAVATAWSSYQANRWNGEQAKAASRANALRISAARAQGLAQGQTQVDVAVFIQWVNATARDDTELADFYEQRFRPEFVPAFDAWQDTDPLTNPEAPPTPFAMPEYQLEVRTEAEQLDAQSEVASAAGSPQHPAIGQLRARRRPLCGLPVLRRA